MNDFLFLFSEREGVVVGLDQSRLGGEDPQVGGGQEQRRLLHRPLGANVKVSTRLVLLAQPA